MKKKEIQMLKKRYEKLATQLSGTDLILQGTITERTITTKAPGDHNGTRAIGPYYQWTFKRQGKTTTVNLSKAQVKRFQKAIDSNKRTEDILKEMRELSREILEASTKSVTRRKRNVSNDL